MTKFPARLSVANKHAEGFTLVELLVVIAIIGVLVASNELPYGSVHNSGTTLAMKASACIFLATRSDT